MRLASRAFILSGEVRQLQVIVGCRSSSMACGRASAPHAQGGMAYSSQLVSPGSVSGTYRTPLQQHAGGWNEARPLAEHKQCSPVQERAAAQNAQHAPSSICNWQRLELCSHEVAFVDLACRQGRQVRHACVHFHAAAKPGRTEQAHAHAFCCCSLFIAATLQALPLTFRVLVDALHHLHAGG